MDLIIARTLGLLVVAILVAIVVRRLKLPYTVGLVIAGMALAISRVQLGVALTHDMIFDLLLPPLLFDGALNLNCRQILRDVWPIAILSIVGVIISASVVTIGLIVTLKWPFEAALLFGVLIAATDPVSVIALFKNLGIRGRLRLLVESESLFNDGVAAVLFSLALAWSTGNAPMPLQVARSLAMLVGGGVAVGLLVGAAAILIAGRSDDPLVETAVTLVAAYGAFLAAESLHFSGVLATVASGLLMGTVGLPGKRARIGISHEGRTFALDFWEFMAFIANSIVFLLIGLAVSRFPFASLGRYTIAIVIGIVLLSRAATVYPISFLLRYSVRRIPRRDQHLLWWSGLRGALALALALSIPPATPLHDAIEFATFAVVVFSVVVQGVTMPLLLRHLGYGEGP